MKEHSGRDTTQSLDPARPGINATFGHTEVGSVQQLETEVIIKKRSRLTLTFDLWPSDPPPRSASNPLSASLIFSSRDKCRFYPPRHISIAHRRVRLPGVNHGSRSTSTQASRYGPATTSSIPVELGMHLDAIVTVPLPNLCRTTQENLRKYRIMTTEMPIGALLCNGAFDTGAKNGARIRGRMWCPQPDLVNAEI
ncbi:hypothetical protein EJ07DRAFT_153252 [Lizonia empirigonia]|nr:hypothetical protein EJ07DRAFT_153252 [Lizonia empirigonia]